MRQTNKIDATVRVEPRALWNYGAFHISGEKLDKNYIRDIGTRCEEIVDDIKRHAENVGDAFVEWETEDVCSHCGYPWTEASDTYNGGCCEEDEKNNPSNNPPSTGEEK